MESGNLLTLGGFDDITLWPEADPPVRGRSVNRHPRLHEGDLALILEAPPQNYGRAKVLTSKGVGWVSLWALRALEA